MTDSIGHVASFFYDAYLANQDRGEGATLQEKQEKLLGIGAKKEADSVCKEKCYFLSKFFAGVSDLSTAGLLLVRSIKPFDYSQRAITIASSSSLFFNLAAAGSAGLQIYQARKERSALKINSEGYDDTREGDAIGKQEKIIDEIEKVAWAKLKVSLITAGINGVTIATLYGQPTIIFTQLPDSVTNYGITALTGVISLGKWLYVRNKNKEFENNIRAIYDDLDIEHNSTASGTYDVVTRDVHVQQYLLNGDTSHLDQAREKSFKIENRGVAQQAVGS